MDLEPHRRQGRFPARRIELALVWTPGTPDPPKRSRESDFDSGGLIYRGNPDKTVRVVIGLPSSTDRLRDDQVLIP